MKKYIVFFLILLVAALSFTSCGKREEEEIEILDEIFDDIEEDETVIDILDTDLEDETDESENTASFIGSGNYGLSFSMSVKITDFELSEESSYPPAYQLSNSFIPVEFTVNMNSNMKPEGIIFCLSDGELTEFRINDVPYMFYRTPFKNGQTTFNMTLSPEFSEGMGKLDFYLMILGKDFLAMSTSIQKDTVYVVNDELEPNEFVPAVDNEPLLYSYKEGLDGFGGTYQILYADDKEDTSKNIEGPESILLDEDQNLTLDLFSSFECPMKTVVIIGDEPVLFYDENVTHTSIKWESKKDQMARVDVMVPKTEMYQFDQIYVISTPIVPAGKGREYMEAFPRKSSYLYRKN